MAFNKGILFKKLPRFLQRLLRMLRIAPEPPKVLGLFTENGRGNHLDFPEIGVWYSTSIRDKPITRECLVIEVGWYKKENGVKHEFIRFDISSPDTVHTAIVIAERLASRSDSSGSQQDPQGAAQTTNATTSPVIPTDAAMSSDTPQVVVTSPDAASESTGSSAEENSPPVVKAAKPSRKSKRKLKRPSVMSSAVSKSWECNARDRVLCATLGSTASVELETMCNEATRISTLKFSEEARPSANQIANLIFITSTLEPKYRVNGTQCYWFVETLFEVLKILFKDSKQDIMRDSAGKCYGMTINTKKDSVQTVLDRYNDSERALLEEINQKRRAEQQTEEERQREREERQAAEERARTAEERTQAERLAAEERIQAERRAAEERIQAERRAAEEKIRAAEEEKQRERQAANEEIAKLRRQLEAARAGASTSQV
ncbi:hypothetical protein EDD15DRAFT_2371919 [Pisolithus albus]|nr:hypothetical protein EDD15DRAFT_2371919 [Pisolithus albus]